MPLHDWSEARGWEGVHLLWIAELLRWIKPRLPYEYRAYVGNWPILGIGSTKSRPDVGVLEFSRSGPERPPRTSAATDAIEPDIRVMAPSIDPGTSLFVERAGFLVAAVELISPRNKDRPSSREIYASRYAGYLLESVNLLLIDVHPRPAGFSFAEVIDEEMGFEHPPLPTPHAVAYGVGEPTEPGSFLSIWRRPLAVGAALPTLPLPLAVDLSVTVDLEETYMRAASDAYLT